MSKFDDDMARGCLPTGEPLECAYGVGWWTEMPEEEPEPEPELKPCPFCGGTKICTEKSINLNYCDNCSAESNVEHWNTRPIEDELRKRIAALKGVIEILEDQQRDVKNILIDKNLHIDSLYEEGYKLQQRIAELEAEVTKGHELQDSYCDRIAELERDFDMLFRSSANKQPRKNTQTLTFEYGMESEIDQLTARWRQERQDDKSSPEVQE